MSEYDDMFGEIAVNKANKKRLEKDIASGQKSLFFDYDARNNENTEGMKKAAVEKANKEEAAKEAQEKAKTRAAENEELKKKNQQRPMISPGGNIFKGATSGGGGIEMEGKMGRNTKPKMKAGGKVKSASSRADGCCVRGKTRA
jgi:membrane protein involved in colicin uptake